MDAEIQRMHEIHRCRKRQGRKLPALPIRSSSTGTQTEAGQARQKNTASQTTSHMITESDVNSEAGQVVLRGRPTKTAEPRYKNMQQEEQKASYLGTQTTSPTNERSQTEDVYEEMDGVERQRCEVNTCAPSILMELAASQAQAANHLSLADELHAIGTELDAITKTNLCKEFVQRLSVSRTDDLGSPETLDVTTYRDSGFIDGSSSSSHEMSSSAETSALTVAFKKPPQRDDTTQTMVGDST